MYFWSINFEYFLLQQSQLHRGATVIQEITTIPWVGRALGAGLGLWLLFGVPIQQLNPEMMGEKGVMMIQSLLLQRDHSQFPSLEAQNPAGSWAVLRSPRTGTSLHTCNTPAQMQHFQSRKKGRRNPSDARSSHKITHPKPTWLQIRHHLTRDPPEHPQVLPEGPKLSWASPATLPAGSHSQKSEPNKRHTRRHPHTHTHTHL